MLYVCDAPGGATWFQIETEAEAARESDLMGHAVEKHFCLERKQAASSYAPRPGLERDIGLELHIRQVMPAFLTLRDREGGGLATAMLLLPGRRAASARSIIVGPRNSDPYPKHGKAIDALAAHLGLKLDRARCFPY